MEPSSDRLQTFSDDTLATRALQDPEAFTALYRRYARRLYNYLYSKTGCTEDAEDLTAQVFSEVIKSLSRYQPQGTFAAWIFTIARRKAANGLRHRRGWLPLEMAERTAYAFPDPLKQVIEEEELAEVRRCIQLLKAEDIELLRLHFAAGLTYREMATLLGKTESAVGVNMHRLLRRLEEDCEAKDG